MKSPGKAGALIATGAGFLYFCWVYATTGIFTGRRGDVAVAASEDPERFSIAVAIVLALGLASLVAGLLMILRK
jgi:hypothetical protein